MFSQTIEPFDIIVSNPPYFKLPIDDKRAVAAKAVINGHPNIYAIFMAISARLLKENGQLIFITPRSYASGSYFKLFREYFFKIIEIDKVHLFVSRKDTFNRDKVLQETVIIKGTRKGKTNPKHKVNVYSSHGLKDIDSPIIKSFAQKEAFSHGKSRRNACNVLHIVDMHKIILRNLGELLYKIHTRQNKDSSRRKCAA